MQTLPRLATSAAARRGSALAMVTLTATVLATLSFSILAISMSGMREQRASKEQIGARYVCEAGLSEAIFELSKGNSGAVGSKDAPVALDNASYWVEATDLGGSQIQLLATGEVDRAGQSIEMTVRAVSETIYVWGAFGDEGMGMDSNARVDSYDATLGTYASQKVNGSGTSAHAKERGDVGSNKDVNLEGNIAVWGNASPGPGGAINDPSNVSGSTAPLPATLAMPAITVPAIASSGPLTVPGATPLALPSGDHRFDQFSVEAGGLVTVTGPARVIFEDFHLNSNAQFIVDASAGPVEVFVMGDFILDSNTLMAPSDYLPAHLDVKLLSDNVYNPGVNVQLDLLDMNSNAQLYGTLYAPEAVVKIDSNFELFGSLVARQVQLSSNARIHYDESLATSGSSGIVTYEIVCWRTVAYRP